MDYLPPKAVVLTEKERNLYEKIPDDPTHEGWDVVEDSMVRLMDSLISRDAIPEVRLLLFCDPAYAETGTKSRQAVFESNGTRGEAIFRHPDFIKYLRHFINGPDLPSNVIAGLCRILNEDRGTSGMVMDQYRKFARNSVRTQNLDRHDAATEFFRLGVEIGMTLQSARILRDAAFSAR